MEYVCMHPNRETHTAVMCFLPVTDNSCIGQQFKDPQEMQPEKIPPLSTPLVLETKTAKTRRLLLQHSALCNIYMICYSCCPATFLIGGQKKMSKFYLCEREGAEFYNRKLHDDKMSSAIYYTCGHIVRYFLTD